MCSTSYAASFGHSRIVSALGQPLRIDVPVSQLTPDDLRSFHVSAAPASAWAQAGLTPPVDLTSISLELADGYTPGSKVIQLRSTEPFDKPVADLLLDVRTASGQQRYQVSLLTHASQDATGSAAGLSQGQRAGAAAGPAASQATGQRFLPGMIRVKKGDTMFAIARRHAVSGVTVYQMMMALQKANPQAFIQGNINLVKAGATLAMPDMAGLTAMSDKEARRLFAKQAQAFALYRQRLAASTPAVATEGSASQGVVTSAGGAEPAQAAPAAQDQLRLSRGQASPAASASGITGASRGNGSTDAARAASDAQGSAGGSNAADARADDSVATRKEIDESKERVSQLEQNVKNLSEALQAQGGAATDLIVDGAKGLSQSLSDVADAVTSPGGAGAVPGASAAGAAGGAAGAAAAGGAAAGGAAAGGAAAGGAAAGAAAGSNSTPAQSGSTAQSHGAANAGSAAGLTAGSNPGANGTSASASPQGGGSGSGESGGGSAASGSNAAGSNAPTASGAPANALGATSSSTNGGKPDAASAGSSAAPAAGAPAAGAPAAGTSATGATGAAGSNGVMASGGSGPAGAPGSGASGNAASSSGNAAAGNAAAGNAAAAAGAPAAGGPGATAGNSDTAPAAGLASAAPSPGSAASEGAANRADETKPSSGADRAGDVAEPISTKAEQTVSWIQEHMLGVITGLLALIVLVIAWLLRRANAGRDDGRDDHSGLITEAMVREKLDQINLDLSQSSADDAPSRRR